MKKMLLLAGVVIALASCNNSESGYKITGKLQGFEDGTKVYLSEIDANNPMGLTKIDSAEVKGGTFELKGEAKDIDIKYFEIGKTQEYVMPFILENGSIVVDFNKENREEANVTGSKNNDYLTSFNKEAFGIQKQMRDFQQNNMQKFQEAQINNDEAAMNSLKDEYESLNKQLSAKTLEFVKSKKDSYVSLILLEQLGMSQEITSKEFKDYYNALDKEVKETKKGKEIAENLKKIAAVEVGNIAPDFSAPNPEGTNVSLKESLGKVTIVDFWASWCGPCRQENPNVVKLYNQYKDKGLAIVGVSLDKDAERWKKAIADDQLAWIHVSNLQQWQDPIAKEYAVTSIPATFILDENGKILARDLRGEELEAKIAELLQ